MDFGGQWVGGSIHHCLLSLTNGGSYDLGYDAFGRCVKRPLNGTTIYYTYDGPHPIYEWKADGTRAGWNLYGQGIDEILLRADYQVLSNGQGYFFQQNRLGSVTYLTGFSGEVIEQYRYDAFGQPTTTYSGGSFNNRFKFTGREYQEAFRYLRIPQPRLSPRPRPLPERRSDGLRRRRQQHVPLLRRRPGELDRSVWIASCHW